MLVIRCTCAMAGDVSLVHQHGVNIQRVRWRCSVSRSSVNLIPTLSLWSRNCVFLIILSLWNCSAPSGPAAPGPPRPPANHPANPMAMEAPIPSPSTTLLTNSSATKIDSDQRGQEVGRPSTASQPAGAVVIYTCPMHPEVQSNEPGRCPKCGMKLVPKQPIEQDDGGRQ